MDKQAKIINEITGKGLLPLYYHPSEFISINVLRALYKAGIRAVEYTNRGEKALSNFKAMKQVCLTEMQDMYLGIGTIKNVEAANAFISAGADFIISPGLADEVTEAAKNENAFWIPGCMTPSEIMKAETYGVKMVKLFPGNMLGADFVSAVKDLFPGMLFMPTGGVDTTQENLWSWFTAGVCAVGMGSKLLSKGVMEDSDSTRITELTIGVLQTIASIRKTH